MRFTWNTPVNLLFGRGRLSELGVETARCGTKALVVVGMHSAAKTGLLDRIVGLLAASGVKSVVFAGIESNPLSSTVSRGTQCALESGCDVVVGVGGGSVMDAAKAIAFEAQNPGDIWDFIFGRKEGTAALPVILAPTTAGTGSEGNCFAVLTNPDTGDKKSLRTPLIYARASIIDPDLLLTLPLEAVASAGFDALTHTVEAYLSVKAQPMTDLLSLEGLRLLAQHLPEVYAQRGNLASREAVSWASTLGGMVISTAGVGLAHALEHPVSGLYGTLSHGAGLAALYPPVIRFTAEAAPEKLGVVSRLLGGKDASDAGDAFEGLLGTLGLQRGLGELGVRASDIDWMTGNCLKVSLASLGNSPRVVREHDIRALYQESL